MFTMSLNDSQAEGHDKAVVCDTMSTSSSCVVLTTAADLTVNVVEEHHNQVVEESSEEEQPQHLTSSSSPILSSSTSIHHHPLTLDQLRIMIKDPILLSAESSTPGDDSLVLSSPHILLSSALGVDDDNRPLSTTSCPGSDDAMIGSDIGAGGPRSSSPPASFTSLASNQSTILGNNKSTNQVSTSTSSNSESSSPSEGMSFDSHNTHPLPFETTSVIGDEDVMEEKEVEDEEVQSSSQQLLEKHLLITSVPTTTGMETSLSSSESPDSAPSSFLSSSLSSEEPGNGKRKRVESESSNLSSTTTMSSTTTSNSNVVAVSSAGPSPSVPKENKNKKRKTASRSTTASSSPPVTSSSTPLSVQSPQPQQFFTQHTVVSSPSSSPSSLSAPSLAIVSVISNAPNTATLASATPPPVGKSSKSSAKGMGCGRPGYITCSICSATKYYSHVQRRFGQFACEPCSKFMKRFLRDPKKFTCYDAGNCLIGRPSGEQEPRGVSVSRCKACWLKICLEKFVVEPAIKEVIHQHYLPVFLNGKGGVEVTVGNVPVLPSLGTTSPSSLPGYNQRAHSLPSHSSSLGVVNHSSHTTFASSIPGAVLTNALSSHHSLPPPPPLPLPSRKRKVKDSLPPGVVMDSTSHASISLSNTSVSTIGCGLSASYLTTTSSPLHDILTSPSKTTRTSCSFQAHQSLQTSVKTPRSPRKNPSTVKYKKVEPKSPGGKGGGKGTTAATTTASKAGRGRKSAGGKFGVNDFSSSSSTLPSPSSSSVVVQGVHSSETQATTDVVKRENDGDENHSSVLSVSHFTSPTTGRSRGSGKGTKTAGRRGRANTNTSSSSDLMENEPRAKFAPIKGRKGRKGKGYLHGFGYNHDHDYGSLPVQFMEEDDVHDEDDIADNVVGDVVIIKTESDAIPPHYKSSVVVLRESNEDHSEMRGRGASFSHLRNHPESPKAGTRAEDSSLSPDAIDTNFYSSTTDLISSTEEVMMREFNHPHHSLSTSFVITSSSSLTPNTSTPNISGKGKRKKGGSTPRVKSAGAGRSKKSTSLTSRSSSFIGLGKRAGLNQENEKFSPSKSPNRRNRNATITSSPFVDSKFSRTTEEYDDLMSTFDDVHSSSLHSHSSKHHHPSSTSSHFTTPRDDDSDEEGDDDLDHRGGDDDDEGYDDYFDPVSIRDAIGTRDSLFFDEILNTNSPFL